MSKLFKYTYLTILFIFLLLYSYNDITTSEQAGFRETVRTVVYIFLLGSIAMVVSYVLFCSRKIRFRMPFKTILITLAIWILITNIMNGSDLWITGIHAALCLWWVFTYMFFALYLQNNPKSEGRILFLISIMLLFYIWGNVFLRINITSSFEQDFAVSGFIYQVVMMVPFILLIKKKMIKKILIIGSLFMIVTSFKRGAIIATTFMYITFIYSDAIIKNKPLNFLKQIVIFSLLGGFSLVYIDLASGGFLSTRFSSESLSDGSGRADMWELLINHLESRDLITFLVGTGSGSTIKLLGTGAHNEWLEFLFSFGLVGVIIYLALYMKFLFRYMELLKRKSKYAPYVGMMVIYLLCVSMYSGMYFQHSTFYIFAFWGFIEYLIQKEFTIKINK
ncbi:MAG: hypothetical protein R3Y26_08235 [Rikenellaceae bacterium]